MTVRLLRDTTNVLAIQFFSGETPTDADGSVSVVVVDHFGVAVTSGTADDAAGVGNYTFELPAQDAVKVLRVTWSGVFQGDNQEVVQEYEIVGAFLFSLAELRAMDGLDDTTTYPTTALVRVRDDVTDLVNQFTATSFGEAWNFQAVTSSDYTTLPLFRRPVVSLLSAERLGTAIDIDDWWVDQNGLVQADITLQSRTVIQYSYGHSYVPGDLAYAARRLARHWLLQNPSSIPDRARMMTTSWGQFHLNAARPDNPTGLDDVDETLRRYRDDTWEMGFA